MAITQKSRWDDVGSEPPTGEAKYSAGEQPIAEYDNWFNKSVADDIAAINAWLDNLGLTKVYIDTEANMPASGLTTELFIATDTNKIYRGTGTGWQELTVDWNAILNKPSVFPPEAHQHDDSDLLGVDWSKILNKPSTYPPEAHTHTISEITDIGNASVNYANSAGDADTLDGFDSDQFLRKDIADTKTGDLTINGNLLSDTLRFTKSYKLPDGTDLDTVTTSGFYDGVNLINAPNGDTSWWYIVVQRHANSEKYVYQIAIDLNTDDGTFYIRKRMGDVWREWTKVITERNAHEIGGGVTYSTPTVYLGNGETLQLARFTLPAGKSFKVLKAQVAKSDGTSASGLSIEVYDNTNGTSVYSTSSATVQEGSPLATSNAGVEIIIRIKNNTGAAVECQGFVVGVIA